MDFSEVLTEDEIRRLSGRYGDSLEALYEHYIDFYDSRENAVMAMKDLADFDRRAELIEKMRTRPVKKSPDFLLAKEDIKRYFARITNDPAAVEKITKRGKRMKNKVTEEREVADDLRGIVAATRLYCVEPIAQAFKHKLFLHWENTHVNVLTMNEAIYLGVGGGHLPIVTKNIKKSTEAIIEKGVSAIEENSTQALLTIMCARLLEAYIDSPHIYLYIRGTDEEGNVCGLLTDEIRGFLKDSAKHLTHGQRAQLEENVACLLAAQSEEVAKACSTAAKKIDPARIRTCENVVGVYTDNEEKITLALYDAMQAEGGLHG